MRCHRHRVLVEGVGGSCGRCVFLVDLDDARMRLDGKGQLGGEWRWGGLCRAEESDLHTGGEHD